MLKEHFLKLSKIKKRVFAGAMATALISTSVNIGTFVAEAGNSKNGSVITAFEELPEETAYQYLPIGSEEYDIEFPRELNVTIYSNEDTEGTEEENEDAFQERTTRRESREESGDEEGSEETRETRESEDNESDSGDSENRENESNEPVNEGSQVGDEDENNDNGSEEVRENSQDNEGDAAQPAEDEDSNGGNENSSENSNENSNNGNNDNGTDTDIDTAVNNTVDTTTAPESVPEGGETEDDTLISQAFGLTASPIGGSLAAGHRTTAEGDSFKAFPPRGKVSAELTDEGISSVAEAASALFGPVTVYAAEPGEDDGLRELSEGEARTLKNVTWTLIKDESTYSRFQAVRAGDVFVFEPLLKNFGLKSDVALPKIRVTITEEDGSYEEREEATEEATEEAAEETVSDNEAEETEEETVSENEAEETEETVSENEAEEESVSENEAEPEVFDQMMIVGGVRVRVEAPEGVFPAGSTLKVVRLGDSDEETAKEVISRADNNAAGNTDAENAENTENTGSAGSMDIILFDVTILDKDGNEIQPDTGIGVPRITFENAEIIDRSVDGGNTNEDGGLTVYHFDDGFSGVEKLETEVNKGEKSVSAPAEHFSTYALTAAVNYTTHETDDYYIETSDGCVVTNSDSTYVGIFPSSDANIRVSMKGSTADQRIEFLQHGNINMINLELNGIKFYGDSFDTGIIYINDDIKNAVITLNNTSLISSTDNPALNYNNINTNTNITFLLKGDNRLESSGHGIKGSSNSRVTIKGSGSVNDKLTIKPGSDKKAIDGSASVSIESGHVDVDSSTQFSSGTLSISGGWHVFPYSFINSDNTQNSNIKITGGSVNFNIDSANDATKGTQTFNGGIHKLYVIDLPSESANTKITRVFNYDGAAITYGTVDLYTDLSKKAYIWLPENTKIYGVEANGKWFALSSSVNTPVELTPYSSSKAINRLTEYDIGKDITVKYNGSTTPADWYPGTVGISATGYLVSDSSSGPFKESYTWTGNGKAQTKNLYFKYVANATKIYYGAVVSKTVGPVNFSTGKPTGTIKVIKKSSSKIQTKAKTMGYTNEADKVTITANKNSTVAGVNKTEYYFTDKFYGDENAINKAASGNWAEYNEGSKPALIENKLNYCYAQFTDNAGNTGYVSTQGVWYDTIDPKVKSAKATPEDTNATVEVKGEDKESGIGNYYVLAKKKTESKPTKDKVKSSGKKSDNGNVEVTGLTANTAYKFYCVIEDKCGNLSPIKECSTTTKETKKEDAAAGAAAGQGSAAGAGGKGGAGSTGAGAGSDKLGESNSKKHGVGAESDKADEEEKEKEETEIKSRIPYIEDATEGIQIGKENTSGWDKIEEETGKAEAPAEIHIDMNGSSVVPATALNSIEGRDITCFYEMGDDVIWAVNGMSIGDKVPDDIDFKVKTDTKNIPSKLVNEVADVYPHKNLSIAYDGEFGFTAIMCLNVGEENAGMYANRYYYNEEEGSLEFIDSEDVDGNGNTEFEFTHASDYTIVIRGDALTEKSAAALVNTSDDGSDLVVSEAADPPKKSNNHWWLLLITILSLILCGVILFMPDRKRQQG